MSMDRKIEKSKWPFRKIAIYAVVLAGLTAIISMIVRDAGTSRLNVESER